VVFGVVGGVKIVYLVVIGEFDENVLLVGRELFWGYWEYVFPFVVVGREHFWAGNVPDHA